MLTIAKNKLSKYYFDLINLIEMRNEINYLKFISFNDKTRIDKLTSKIIHLNSNLESENINKIKKMYELGDQDILNKVNNDNKTSPFT